MGDSPYVTRLLNLVLKMKAHVLMLKREDSRANVKVKGICGDVKEGVLPGWGEGPTTSQGGCAYTPWSYKSRTCHPEPRGE